MILLKILHRLRAAQGEVTEKADHRIDKANFLGITQIPSFEPKAFAKLLIISIFPTF
jgi:hypothetical protein